MLKKTFLIFILINYTNISGCVGIPKNQGDACSIIKQKKSWRSALKKTERKWGISPGMQLAFIKTESNFRPFVTDIGLYSENNELLAHGKLAKPIKLSDDIETTFIVRFDV